MIANYTDPSIANPTSISAGPDGALWFTNYNNNSIGRITTSGGIVTHYTNRQRRSEQHHVGPDGALWFTNHGNHTIGRITTGGVVTQYTATGVANPYSITAGPDGAMWFTNNGYHSIGRISTGGVVSHYTNPEIAEPARHHRRTRRCVVVRQRREQLDRSDHRRHAAGHDPRCADRHRCDVGGLDRSVGRLYPGIQWWSADHQLHGIVRVVG